MRKRQWHSITEMVYHTCTNCQAGQQLEPASVREGTGSKPLCKECQRLLNTGRC
jgi:hypothetical protein